MGRDHITTNNQFSVYMWLEAVSLVTVVCEHVFAGEEPFQLDVGAVMEAKKKKKIHISLCYAAI